MIDKDYVLNTKKFKRADYKKHYDDYPVFTMIYDTAIYMVLMKEFLVRFK